MKKVKLNINFLSAAGTAFGLIAVLFSSPRAAAVVIAREVPFFRRR